MADPILSKTIGVKVSAASAGDYVIVRNITRGGQMTGKVNATDKGIVFNRAITAQWENKDVVQGEITGSVSGVGQATIRGGGAVIKITASADTSTPGVLL